MNLGRPKKIRRKTITPEVTGFVVGGLDFVARQGLVPLINCTTTPPCGHCWYCSQRSTKGSQ